MGKRRREEEEGRKRSERSRDQSATLSVPNNPPPLRSNSPGLPSLTFCRRSFSALTLHPLARSSPNNVPAQSAPYIGASAAVDMERQKRCSSAWMRPRPSQQLLVRRRELATVVVAVAAAMAAFDEEEEEEEEEQEEEEEEEEEVAADEETLPPSTASIFTPPTRPHPPRLDPGLTGRPSAASAARALNLPTSRLFASTSDTVCSPRWPLTCCLIGDEMRNWSSREKSYFPLHQPAGGTTLNAPCASASGYFERTKALKSRNSSRVGWKTGMSWNPAWSAAEEVPLASAAAAAAAAAADAAAEEGVRPRRGIASFPLLFLLSANPCTVKVERLTDLATTARTRAALLSCLLSFPRTLLVKGGGGGVGGGTGYYLPCGTARKVGTAVLARACGGRVERPETTGAQQLALYFVSQPAKNTHYPPDFPLVVAMSEAEQESSSATSSSLLSSDQTSREGGALTETEGGSSSVAAASTSEASAGEAPSATASAAADAAATAFVEKHTSLTSDEAMRLRSDDGTHITNLAAEERFEAWLVEHGESLFSGLRACCEQVGCCWLQRFSPRHPTVLPPSQAPNTPRSSGLLVLGLRGARVER